MQEPYVEEEIDLVSFLEETAIFLWKDWPKDMRISRFTDRIAMTLVGTCPHCGATATFEQAAGMFQEQGHQQGEDRAVAAMRCIGCDKFILAIAKQQVVNQAWTWVYVEHYPLGKPKDAVSEDFPENVRLDLQEAIRCQWVEAHNATVEMCRRAIENCCLHKGVPNNIRTLAEMIDWLAEKNIITPGLRDTADKVRLGGDRGAHPPQGIPPEEQQNEEGKPIMRIEKEHADAVVGFTQHFLHHVYVIPKQLEKYDFSRTKPPKTS